MRGYDPFTYNTTLRNFFMGNTATMPDTVAKVAAENPQLADHINSVWSFMEWIKKSNAPLYNALSSRKPELADPAHVVTSGKLTPVKGATCNGNRGLSGLSDYSTFPITDDIQDPGNAANTSTSTNAGGPPTTQWGQDILSFVKSTLPTYYQAQAQRDLLQINLKRAEQGLPPIDGSSIAPQVNVGVSQNVQMLGYIAVGGLVIVGLLSAMGKRR